MPAYADAPIPPQLERVMVLGMNRVRVSLLVALAAAGGTLDTPALMIATGGQSVGTVLRHLRALEADGYVTGVPDGADRKGRLVVWTLNPGSLHDDLAELVRQTTPAPPT